MLGLFKYGGFLMAQLAPAIHLFGVHQLPRWPLALPFGISFFTFHALSYLIDVYRRDVRPSAICWRSPSTSPCSRS